MAGSSEKKGPFIFNAPKFVYSITCNFTSEAEIFGLFIIAGDYFSTNSSILRIEIKLDRFFYSGKVGVTLSRLSAGDISDSVSVRLSLSEWFSVMF